MKQLFNSFWRDEKYFIFIRHASIKKHTWKVYKRGKGILNLVAEKAYVGIHHGVPLNGKP
jgi:hypothetical protein